MYMLKLDTGIAYVNIIHSVEQTGIFCKLPDGVLPQQLYKVVDTGSHCFYGDFYGVLPKHDFGRSIRLF